MSVLKRFLAKEPIDGNNYDDPWLNIVRSDIDELITLLENIREWTGSCKDEFMVSASIPNKEWISRRDKAIAKTGGKSHE